MGRTTLHFWGGRRARRVRNRRQRRTAKSRRMRYRWSKEFWRRLVAMALEDRVLTGDRAIGLTPRIIRKIGDMNERLYGKR